MFNKLHRPTDTLRSSWALGLAAFAGSLVASAVWNERAEKRAEQRNPPLGHKINVDGVTLHYLDTGGLKPAVLLIHGNGVTSADMEISGLIDALKDRHRVIAFDRPGYGYSERPRNKSWTPEEQADLFAKALAQLKVETVVVLGHSWGTLVAVACALRHPQLVNGLVLASGYYFPTVRLDVVVGSLAATPLLGEVMRRTISPLIGRLMAPAAFAEMFAPMPIPERFSDRFPVSLSFRSTQLRASSEEASMMVPAARRLSSQYGAILPPVTIIAGEGDQIVDFERQSKALHEAVPGSSLRLFPGVGHMVHYAATAEIAGMIDELAAPRKPLAA
ncbi:alpha/beta hydrolase [Rhodoblastus sp.]|jgi:pimeloyl-ACP methyl ester carboxylesterase|uniref:alpha/beta fold hydrolase n=1 Tax=Rhodoblastus sp. TaxID=1962975 RepID=UPI0025FF0B5F|nr:alpha/beta hydrolase [Rhodoblastus sp.]